MGKQITLTDQESTLRQFLLDVSTYIGTLDGYKKPELRFTGGWVRDKFLGLRSVDIDVGIDSMTGYNFGVMMKEYLAQPESKAKYERIGLGGLAKIEANPEKSKHLETVTTKILGLDIDLVNLRKEIYLESSRNPLMEFGTPEEDALRRDATVNALFYNLGSSKVEDLTGRGFEDMELKVIKTPLAPLQTFKDDPLRLLRAIRFASRFDYEIAAEDAKAMRNQDIKDALRLKISRERVGVEVTKMLKGPNPRTALSLIDRLGLYNEVFTNPKDTDCSSIDTARWSRAYDLMLEIIKAEAGGTDTSSSLKLISKLLVRSPEDVFLAWMITCFVPWAREPQKHLEKPSSKKTPSPASIAAREGIKADNKITKVVDEAVSYLSDIIAMKDSVITDSQSTSSPLKRRLSPSARVFQGLAVRRWGSHWRISAMYAILAEVGESQTEADRQMIMEGYATWISDLQSLDLLDIDKVKPMVHGNQLTKALGIESGPWLKKALDITMEWQIRNPEQTDTAGAIAEVVERKKELGIT